MSIDSKKLPKDFFAVTAIQPHEFGLYAHMLNGSVQNIPTSYEGLRDFGMGYSQLLAESGTVPLDPRDQHSKSKTGKATKKRRATKRRARRK